MSNSKLMRALQATPNGKGVQHGQDLGSYIDFHHKAGQYMVVDVRDTVPNSYYEMGVDGFTRTLLCNTANFAHIKENYYFIHVPLGLINRNAYQLQVDRQQEYSALEMGITSFPYFPLKSVVDRLFEISQLDLSQSANAKWKDIHGFNMAYGAIKLLDMLGYGYFGDLLAAIDAESLTVSDAKAATQVLIRDKFPSVSRIGAYQCTWYHFFRNDIYDVDVSARCFNFDDVTYSDGVNAVDFDVTHKRSLDDFILECLQLRYVGYKKDIFTASMPGTQYGPVSSVPISVNFDNLSASFVGNQGNVNVNQVLEVDTSAIDAYEGSATQLDTDQHKFYNYVNDRLVERDFSQNPWGNNDVSLGYKANKVSNRGRSPYALNHGNVDDPDLQLQVQTNDSETSPIMYDLHKHYITSSDIQHNHVVRNVQSAGVFTPTGTVNLSGGATSTSLFDVLQLVEAQAIQKWRQKSMLAGNKTADQFRAHHGVVPKHLIDHLPDFIGSVDNEIHVTEITSQADTASSADESNLGEIRGRGYGASDARSFRFYSDDYGVLLLIHAIVPENVYDSYGIDKGNTMLQYTDFFQSEFMNIGLEAVPKYLLAPSYGNDTPSNPSQEGGDTFNPSTGLIGYAPRYYNYKQYPSKVHGLFNSSRIYLGSTPFDPNPNIFGYSDMQSFVMPRRDMTTILYMLKGSGVVSSQALQMTLSSIYVNPRIFDSLFGVAADNSELTDNFFSHVRFYCKASLPMSNLGLPQF